VQIYNKNLYSKNRFFRFKTTLPADLNISFVMMPETPVESGKR